MNAFTLESDFRMLEDLAHDANSSLLASTTSQGRSAGLSILDETIVDASHSVSSWLLIDRKIIVLALSGVSTSEISAKLNVGPETVTNTLQSVVSLLQKQMILHTNGC